MGGVGLMAAIAAPAAFAADDAIGDLIAATQTPPQTPLMTGPRRLIFDNLHTGEKLDVAYWQNGAYVPDALTAVNHVLRDYRNDETHVIHPRLLDLLASLSGSLDTPPRFEVISGYRSPATNAMLCARSSEVAKGSLHMQGEAIDIRVADIGLAHLHRAALALELGGVGYYPESDFVHVDIGRVRRWSGT